MAKPLSKQENSSPSKSGLIFLIAMLVASFACIFISIYLLDTDAPIPEENAGVFWALVSSFGILFPLLATHLHTLHLHRWISWFSWWLGIVALFGILLLALADSLGEEFSSTERQRIYVFYLSVVSASSLGCFAIFAPVRRFLPRLVDYRKPEHPRQRKRFGIKTLLFWTTALAIIGAVYSNTETIGIEMFPRFDYSVHESLLIGLIWGAVFTLFLWLPAIKWFQHFRPYWLSMISLVLVTGLLTMASIGIMTAVTFHFESGLFPVALSFSMQLTFLVLITGCWIYGCRLAGLIPTTKLASEDKRRARGFVRKSFSGINWLSQRGIWLVAAASLIYAAGWVLIHFVSGGEERQISSVTNGTLAESENWLDVANEKWSEGVSPEQNAIVGIIRTLDPIGEDKNAEAYYERLGIAKEMQQAQKSEDDMFAMGMMEMGPPDKTFEYQQSLFEQLYDSDTGENKSLPGVSEAERYFMEAMAQHINFSLFQDAPWDRKMCEPAAVYLKEHQSQLAKLRKISTWNQFYSPWVHESANKSKIRDFGHDVLFSAMDLLQMSAMYHLGNDRVDEAIKDCMAMDRLTRPEWTSRLPNVVLKTFRYKFRKPVANTVLQIAFHPLATSSQLAELQRTLGNREATEPTGFDAEFRDATFRKLGLTSMTQATFLNLAPPSVEKNYPFQVWYVKNPTTVDWESWREAFDATRSKEQELIDAAHRGEIGSWEKERRLHEFKKLDGIDVHKADFYQYVFGHKLFTFVSSPKYKGKILGTIAADKILNFADYDIFYGQINRDFAKIALGLQRWKKQHGTWPDSLDQLAPEFLEVIPKDVISQQDFVYRKENSSFLLYSVGSNGIDDGGSNSDVMFEHPLPNLIEHHFQNRN